MDLSQPVPGQEVSQDAQAAAAAAVKKLSKADRERTLHSLVTEGWLQHSSSRSGHFCIGPRSFLELPDLLLGLEVPEATRVAWEDFL
jgi:DNA-binding IclR family transcriptional regulator